MLSYVVFATFLDEESLCLLNTGTRRTHLTVPSGQTSALDLSIASPQLASLFSWSVHDDPRKRPLPGDGYATLGTQNWESGDADGTYVRRTGVSLKLK